MAENKQKNKEEVFERDMTVLEQHELVLQIQHFMQKRIPTFIKFKLTQLMNELMKRVKPYTELNNELIEKYADKNGRLQQYEDGLPNAKYKTYRKEIEPVEKEKTKVVFKMFSLSYIMRKDDSDDLGGYPLVYELFYADDLSIRLFDKWQAEKTEGLEAELAEGEKDKKK